MLASSQVKPECQASVSEADAIDLSAGGLSTMRSALVACFGNAQFFQQELTEDLH